MLIREKQAVQVFRRMRDFLTERAPTVVYGSVGKVVEQLTAVIDKLETFAREQDARARQAVSGTRRKRAQVAAIRREFLRPISRAARTIFPADASLQAALTMPRVRDYEGTIAAAEAMAQTASTNKARFVEVGFPDDFVERMQGAATELRAGIDTHAQEFGRRSASTAGLRREYARGRDLVRMLDAMGHAPA